MEDKLPTLQTAATNFVKRLKPNDIAQVIDFDSRVEIRQAFTGNQAELEARDPADGGRRLDVAAQRDLHRAQGAAEGPARSREEDVRRQALDRLLGRRGHVEPGLVRRGARPGQALRDGHLHDRAARRRHPDQGLPRGRVRDAPAGAGNRRPRVLPGQDRGSERRLRADRRRARQPVHARLHVEEPAARRRLAPHRRAGRRGRT